jgi:hypothetical protein
MRLAVPFHANTHRDCGLVTLQMVLEYFGEKHAPQKLARLAEQDEKGLVFTIGLAKAAAQLGFETTCMTRTLSMEIPAEAKGFYQDFTADMHQSAHKVMRLQQEFMGFGGTLIEGTLSMKELLAKIDNDCVAIALIDWRRIEPKPGVLGHFVVIVGYDDKHIFLHQPGPKNPTPFWCISQERFDHARKTPGIDEDIVFIRRKHG